MLATESQTLLQACSMLLNSHAVLVLSVSPISCPAPVYPSGSVSKGRPPRHCQHAGVAAALAKTLGRNLRLARHILRFVLRFDLLQWWATVPPLPAAGLSVEGRMVRTSEMR